MPNPIPSCSGRGWMLQIPGDAHPLAAPGRPEGCSREDGDGDKARELEQHPCPSPSRSRGAPRRAGELAAQRRSSSAVLVVG